MKYVQVDWKILSLIFIINVVYVSLSTIRMMLTMKGYQSAAPLISMIEVTIYVVGLGLVLDNLDNVWNIFVYALGYGVGILVGMKIENMLALGYILVTAIVPETAYDTANELRSRGYGVTSTRAQGREGDRHILEILTPRANERTLYNEIEEMEPKAFVISYEPKYISGGFWTKRMKKERKAFTKRMKKTHNHSSDIPVQHTTDATIEKTTKGE